jgi:transcription termination/antitermination protein NusG
MTLMPDPGSPPVEPRWYACHTRARHEKKVDALMRERGIECYLPLMPVVRQWKDRRKLVLWPLFPGYVFARFTLEDAVSVLSIPGVAALVRTGAQPVPIPADELDNVRRFAAALAESGLEAELVPALDRGQRVRIREGAFAGVRGIVLERRGRRRVRVGLDAIGQGIEVDIAARILEPLPVA